MSSVISAGTVKKDSHQSKSSQSSISIDIHLIVEFHKHNLGFGKGVQNFKV